MLLRSPRRQAAHRLSVIVATPLGKGGHGGIDRIMDEIRQRVASSDTEDVAIVFLTTRGRHHIAFSPIYFVTSLLRLFGLWLAGRADVLHVNLSSHGSTVRKVILCRLARLLSIPYVVHLHGSRFRQFYHQLGRVGCREVLAMFGGAARVIVLGGVWRDFVAGLVPSIEPRIEVLFNATHAPDAAPTRTGGPVEILFLGEVGVRKGVPQLVEALQRLAPMPNWRGVIAGDGEVEQTRAEVQRLGLSNRVRLTGWVGSDAVDRLLAEADVLVLPSFAENLPMSVIEGMGYALAVVATSVGAVPDIVKDGETGLLVPAGDAGRLADALGCLIADSDLRHRLGTRAKAFHRAHLSIDRYLPKLVNIWRLAAGERQADTMRVLP